MIKNYIKIAWRNFVRARPYSIINTVGLAVALCAFIFIALFIYDEWSYDRYHEDAGQLYRVYLTSERDGEIVNRGLSTEYTFAPELKEEIPGIEETARLSRLLMGARVESETQILYEDEFLISDASIFDLFSFSFLQGNPETALDRAYTVVLTESAAERHFGTANPIGRTLSVTKAPFGEMELEVTGLLEDIPSNTHFSFEFLTSIETLRLVMPNLEFRWNGFGPHTYLKLEDGVSPDEVKARFPNFISERYEERTAASIGFGLQPVTDIYLYSDQPGEIQPGSDIRYLYIFGCVAILILVIACINYSNLEIAKGAERALEVGIRKTLGVNRSQLFTQFLTGSLLICSISIVIAVLLSGALLPIFNNLTGKELSLPFSSPGFIGSLILFIVGFSFLIGFYPAMVLSGYNPGRVFKGETSGKKKSLIRNGLIVFQFVVSVALIISTLVISDQLEYMQNSRLGLNEEQVISVDAGDGLGSDFSVFRDELLSYPDIESMGYTTAPIPSATELISGMMYSTGGELGDTHYLMVGSGFLETLEIPLLQGQDIDEFSDSGERDFIPTLINETAMREFGWEDDPIGQTFVGLVPTARVVGVVADFHYRSLKSEIEPLAINKLYGSPRNILIRVQSENMRTTIDRIEQVWNEVGPGTPLVYSFMDDDYDALYRAEDRLASLFLNFTVLGIVLACLGLFGLAAYTAERRTKEIGIRKVLGATVANIVTLLSKDFVKLVLLGFVIAVPIAWYAMNRWLQDFAYKIEIGPGIFALAGGVALLIALATVSWQSVRAALANPVESLRNE